MVVLGASGKHINELRREQGNMSFQNSRLRSTRVAFLTAGKRTEDPAVRAHCLPICAWARLVWTNGLPEIRGKAFERAKALVRGGR